MGKKGSLVAYKRKRAMDGGDCSQRSRGGSKGTVMVRLETELLCCPVCSQPLVARSPIYQCNVGHVVCESCRKKLVKQCPSCPAVTVYRRCIFGQNIVDSAMMLCVNSSYGCKELLSLTERNSHEELCMYFPCFCPEKDCDFNGSKEMLVGHLVIKHNLLVHRFSYNVDFRFFISRLAKNRVLLSDDDMSVFILQTKKHVGAISVSCVCIRPPNFLEPALSFCLRALKTGEGHAGDSDIEFKSRMASTTFEDGVKNDKFSLLVPLEMFSSSNTVLMLDVCIKEV